jgi:serine protease Do
MRAWIAGLVLALLPALTGPKGASGQVVLNPGEWSQGILESTDPCDREGTFYDLYRLPADFQGLARVTLESGDFDAMLQWGVMGGGRFLPVARNDDVEGLAHPTDSRLYAVVIPSERAELRVASWMGEGSGRYRIRWDPVPTTSAAPEDLDFGADLRGVLEEGDAFADGSFEDRFRFQGEAGDVARVILESDDFDVFLELWDPEGRMLASDDDGLGVSNAWLEVELPVSGEYELRVRSYMLEFGEYRLRLGPFEST